MKWLLKPGHRAAVGDPRDHPTITESTTGVVACGDSWCDGRCGLPALTLTVDDKEFRAFGAMVAFGPVFQSFRLPWKGDKVAVTLDETPTAVLLKRFWM
jgi:hypothetical protein